MEGAEELTSMDREKKFASKNGRYIRTFEGVMSVAQYKLLFPSFDFRYVELQRLL